MKHFTRAIDNLRAKWPQLPWVFLRIGLATVFIYAAVSSTISPNDWVSFLPQIVRDNFSPMLVLKAFSVIELVLAVWLLSGVYVRLAGLVCAVMLGGIVMSNFSLFAISFRDIGLIFAALALVFSEELED
jgi:uncharacterized membrane protein YphA (DoxX/SURF4 family)